MAPSAWERPKQANSAATARTNPPNRQPNRQQGGGNNDRRPPGNNPPRNNGNNGGNNPPMPSPWLDAEQEPKTDRSASFVEYLRWMRPADAPQKDGTKVQILDMAADKANYGQRLTKLTDRTKLLAGKGNYFEAQCSWRIRVGGHRGPESILLPAFDALGMPYIPSSTLRGVARTQAIRQIMTEEGLNWKDAEKRVAPWFGSLEAKGGDRAGKVVFFDAYPLPRHAGLAVDMANNIWKWENNQLNYSPNPNPFLSLKEPSFLVGIRLASGCDDPEILNRVKKWLQTGLQAGIGSQVNSGYGQMLVAGAGKSGDEFFQVKFTLEGQLIHGQQKFTQWNWNDRNQQRQMRGQAHPEVRAIAFKSMLRYWFRTFALGVLSPQVVQEWEAKLFGGINPKRERGWVRVDLSNGKVIQREPRPNWDGKNDPCGKQEGILSLHYSPQTPINQREQVKTLLSNLTWMMFHLGGIGQGARRPCYSRKTQDRAPWYRGSTLFPEDNDEFWQLPDEAKDFQKLFQQRLQGFYTALGQITKQQVNPTQPLALQPVSSHAWREAVARNCRIVVVANSPSKNSNKPYALDVLHKQFHELEKQRFTDAKSLCGGVRRDSYSQNNNQVNRDVTPSPIWVADLDEYQVVTVFGATENPRKNYLQSLGNSAEQIWPFR